MIFHFIGCDEFDLNSFKSVNKFLDSYPDFQTIVLNNDQELNLLLQHIGIEKVDTYDIKSAEFSKYWNLTEFQLPEFSEEAFELFYEKWIDISGRENNMDEFGSLIFLQGISPTWNKMNYRLIVKEQ